MDSPVDVLREREQERRARMQLLDVIREPSPQPIFGEPVKVDLEDETSRRIKNTLGDFTQVLVNDPKNLIGISRSNPPAVHLVNGHPSNGYVAATGHQPGYMVAGHLTTGQHQPPGHQMTGYASSGSSGYSSHGSSGYSSTHSGYSSTHSSSSSMGSSSSYGRTQAALKKPPFANGAIMAKPSMPNYVSPKGPDKRSSYKIPLQSSYTSSPAAMKPSHLSGLQQLPYQVQDIRIRDSAPWEGKDQRRVNSIPVTNASVENYVNMNVVNNNNGLSTSAPIWNCGPDIQAILTTTPFHLPSSATPSVPCKEAAKHGQIPTSMIPPVTTPAAKIESATPAKRNGGRPSNLKIQPERKTSTDAPIAVETILKQMTDVVPPAPLTGIQTPRKEETGFAFTSEPKEVDSFLKDNTKDVPSSYFVETISLLSPPPPKPQWEPEPVAITEAPPFIEQTTLIEKPEPVVAEPTAKTNDSDKAVSLQDDLAVSDSEDEGVLESKSLPQKCLKSPIRDTIDTPVNSTVLGTSNKIMEDNSAESSNSSSSEDSDSDDSSSESNDSDSSSEASDEEISSKKWGLSNFVDESQKIYSPAFNPPEAVKEVSLLDAEKVKNSNLNNVNPVNHTLPTQQSATETASFLVPEVPVTAKSEILSPIPSPIHTQVGPRTPPSPPCLKQESSETNKTDSEVLSSETDCKSHDETSKSPSKLGPLPEKPYDNRDISADKGNVQNEKCKKQLRSSKSKELNSGAESSASISADESSNAKELSGTISEKEKNCEKTSSTVIPAISEPNSENYPIKTRQRIVTRRKSAADSNSDSSQKPEENSAIAKLKHPRACRKSTEKQNKKVSTTSTSTKPKSNEDPIKHTKQETKETTNVAEKIKTATKHITNANSSTKPTSNKTPPRSKGKTSKTPPKKSLEDKKPEIKKKKKKFSLKNFVQSPEPNSKPPNELPPFSPSPERSPIPECPKESELPTEATTLTTPSSKSHSKSNSKSQIKVKKVEKLRRSVRCSERASNNAQVDSSTNQPTIENKETKKNSKNSGKTKRSVENASISIDAPAELLSPIPHDPSISSQVSDSVIPVKIMVCIPLHLLSRYPGSSQQSKDTAAKQVSKSTPSNDDANTPKKETSEKSAKNSTIKSAQSKEKTKTTSSIKTDKSSTKSVKTKNKKDVKVENESGKVKSGSNVNKSKVKDKTVVSESESKLPKKRKNESEEKPNSTKKPKLSSRSAEDKKSKEQSLKTTSSTNHNEDTNKSKTLERCDSTGSLSSLCSQQSQRSSKSSKDRKSELSAGPDSKRLKTSGSPLLSVIKQEIKQEKPERPKTHSTVDKNAPVDKKLKCKDKLGLTNVGEQLWDASQYNLFEDSCKEDSKGKILASTQNLTELPNRLAEWDNFTPEIHKEMKEAPALNKHNPQNLVMPMDYYFTEGKKQKLLAEKEKDPFQQAVKFFEAAVLFILTSQQREEYSKDPDSVYQFYSETLKFSYTILSKVKNLQTCPGSTEFKLLILCLKCQSLLSVKLYNLKIKEIKEQLDGVAEFLQVHCPTATNPIKLQSHQSRFSSFFNIQSPHSTIPSPASNSQNSSDRSQSVGVPQNILDTICRQHTHLINLHRGHDLWEQADMYMTRSNLREFFKEVADQLEPLTLHSSITELVKYIQKGLSLVKKSLR